MVSLIGKYPVFVTEIILLPVAKSVKFVGVIFLVSTPSINIFAPLGVEITDKLPIDANIVMLLDSLIEFVPSLTVRFILTFPEEDGAAHSTD